MPFVRNGSAGALGVAALLLGACGSRALSPGAPDAEPPSRASDAGRAGLGPGTGGGATGSAGATGGTGASAGTGSVEGGVVAGAGGSGAVLPLSSVDALARVAAVLWNQLPDDGLLELATSDGLSTRPAFEALVRRMLADPRAHAGVAAFYRWWLDLDTLATLKKDPTLFPEFTPELAADMARETEAFGAFVTLDLNGSFATLMTAPFSLIDARLAAIYGVAGVAGNELQRVDLPAGQRAGLLTQPALQALGSLATRNSPSHRGGLLFKKLYCEVVPFAPPGVPPLGQPPGETLRQTLQIDTGEVFCAACHAVLDPPGLAFEGFDAIGRPRTTDNGGLVDTTNLKIDSPRTDSVPPAIVNGPVELARLLATDPAAEACMAKQWLTFALGRGLTTTDDPSVDAIAASFAASGFSLRELIVDVLTSDAFLKPP